MNVETLAGLLVLVPGGVFLGLAIAWLLGWNGQERILARVTMITYSLLTLGVAALTVIFWQRGYHQSFKKKFQHCHFRRYI